MTDPTPPRATACAVTLLADQAVSVDPVRPDVAFTGQPLAVSSSANVAGQVAYVRFDLAPIPAGATVTACRMVFTVATAAAPAKQVVKVLLVDDDAWAPTITAATAPQPSAAPVGTWLAQDSQRIATAPVNPALLDAIRQRIAASATPMLSVQLRSTFGWAGAPTANTYVSPDSAVANGASETAPRLVVEYQPALVPTPADWAQPRADARHTGRSPWRLDGPPRTAVTATAVAGVVQISARPIVAGRRLLVFTPTALCVLDQRAGTLVQLAAAAGYQAGGLGRDGVLYAASTNELAGFDLRAGATKTVSVAMPAANTTGVMPAPGGGVYVARAGALVVFARQHDTLAVAWQRPFPNGVVPQASLAADGSVIYIVTPSALLACDAADGTEQWTFPFPAASPAPTVPVAGATNGRIYVGVGPTLHILRRNGAQQTAITRDAAPIAGLAIDDADVLRVVQGSTVHTVAADGTPAGAVDLTGAAAPAVEAVLDGAGTLWVLDANGHVFVVSADLHVVATETLPPAGSVNGLLLTPDGTLYASSPSALVRIVPALAANATAGPYVDATCFRADDALHLAAGDVPAGASVVFRAGSTIAVASSFRVPTGATTVFVTGP